MHILFSFQTLTPTLTRGVQSRNHLEEIGKELLLSVKRKSVVFTLLQGPENMDKKGVYIQKQLLSKCFLTSQETFVKAPKVMFSEATTLRAWIRDRTRHLTIIMDKVIKIRGNLLLQPVVITLKKQKKGKGQLLF